jgi:EAL domain-containing protein (putative c-di-GMP-specific phosphodiesterase class I)
LKSDADQKGVTMIEDMTKDDMLDEVLEKVLRRELTASYPVHPFYILEQNSAISFFEPLISVQKMGVIGLETISRAVHPDNQSLIEPRDLFRGIGGEEPGIKLALDRLFRQKSLEGFSPLQIQAPYLLLFLDIESSVLEENVVGSGHLLEQVKYLGLDPRRVVVQVSLSSRINPLLVGKFMNIQRSHGFLTALKDVTASQEHLDLLRRFNPDMVKLDFQLVRGLSTNHEKQEAFLSVVRLAHSLGIVVITGGLDNEEDALTALDFGADLLQGKYFSKHYRQNIVFTLGRKSRMQFLASRYKRRITSRAKRDQDLRTRCKWITSSLFSELQKIPLDQLDQNLKSTLANYPAVECLYLLNAEGTQVSETVCSEYHIPERKKILFHLSPKGSDHSFREYFFALSGGQNRYLTEPALSMNSGHLCVTAAAVLGDPAGEFQIVCADLNTRKV